MHRRDSVAQAVLVLFVLGALFLIGASVWIWRVKQLFDVMFPRYYGGS